MSDPGYPILANSKSPNKLALLAYNEAAKAHKTMDTLAIPEVVIADAATAAVDVGLGSLLRVKGTASQYIWFGPDGTLAAPTITDDTALEMPGGFFHVVAKDRFVRTSSAVRIEVISD